MINQTFRNWWLKCRWFVRLFQNWSDESSTVFMQFSITSFFLTGDWKCRWFVRLFRGLREFSPRSKYSRKKIFFFFDFSRVSRKHSYDVNTWKRTVLRCLPRTMPRWAGYPAFESLSMAPLWNSPLRGLREFSPRSKFSEKKSFFLLTFPKCPGSIPMP